MPGTPDHARPLTARGERDAATMGAWLRDNVSTVSAIRCSTAVRARRTCELAIRGLRAGGPLDVPDPEFSRELYRANSDDLLELVRVEATFRSYDDVFLLVGHNPAIAQAAVTLAAELLPQFVAGAVAVFEIQAGHGASNLVTFATPDESRS